MRLLPFLLALWLGADAMPAARCTIVRTGLPTRLERVTYTVLRPTMASVSDGQYYSFATDRSGRASLHGVQGADAVPTRTLPIRRSAPL